MNPIEINVKVTIGMETALLGMLARLMESREQAPEAVQAPKPTRPAKQPPTPEVKNTVPTQEPAPEATTELQAPEADVAPEAAVVPDPEQEPAQAEEAPAASAPAESAKPKEYTAVDVRAAMDRLRKRIEGESYKEQPDSEGYQKWHKKLTGWFKNTAAICGADKPSELPDSDSRYKFIQCCENVRVENDELTDYCPF